LWLAILCLQLEHLRVGMVQGHLLVIRPTLVDQRRANLAVVFLFLRQAHCKAAMMQCHLLVVLPRR